MYAITCTGDGGPEVLRWTEVDDPSPKGGQVLIDVVAAAVNRADLMQRAGAYPPPPGTSPVLGLECAGTVTALGAGVSGWSAGDRVCALLDGGGYAEQAVVPAGQLMGVPRGVEFADAAALPEAACTVFSTLIEHGRVNASSTVLVHGGASGIGTLAIQLAHYLGARVACTAGSAAKLDRCRELGADLAINYHDEDFVHAVRTFTDGRGVDAVLDIVGGDYVGRNLDALAPDGVIAVIAMQGGRHADLDLAQLLSTRATVYGAGLRARPAEQKAAIVAGVTAQVWPAVETGALRPVIDARFPLREAAAAHRHIERGDHVGKVLLTR